ncbi:acyltransferase, partial [Roseomonas sp. DSM 102946]|nr:acyltransferase [Roseomonas sp. DSM 102946]
MADFYPLPPFFLGMGLLLALAATPLCRPADAPPGQAASRMPALDGLRGILALAVFFHHAAIYPRLLAGQGWGLPPAHAYAVMGKGAVGMFFIITGYLFWAKLLREEGRPSWLALYAGRLFRIGPLYLVVILAMLALLFGRDGGELREPATQVAGQVGEWLLLGAGNRPDVNAHAGTNLLTAGVTWTLQYEWIFYASLPLAALLARTGRRETWLTLALLLLCLAWAGGHLGPWAGADEPGFVTLFLIGMSCA